MVYELFECPNCKMSMGGIIDVLDPDLPIQGRVTCVWCKKQWMIGGTITLTEDTTYE